MDERPSVDSTFSFSGNQAVFQESLNIKLDDLTKLNIKIRKHVRDFSSLDQSTRK